MNQATTRGTADVATGAKGRDRTTAGIGDTPVTPDRAEASADERQSETREPGSIALPILANLAVLFTLYIASDFVIPIVMAIIIYLLLQTPKRLLCNRLRIPAPITSLILILALFSLVGAIGAAVSVPASGWIAKAPESLPTLQEKLSFLRRPLDYVEQGMQKMQGLLSTQGGPAEHRAPAPAEANSSAAPASPASGIGSVGLTVLSGTRAVVGNLFMFVVMLFFLLSSGESLLRRLVEVMPRYRDKRRLVEISEKIEQNISGYLLTITIMNALVGLAVGLATWACGLPDPLLWGTAAFLLNYIPILGPFCGVVVFFFVGLFTYQTWWSAFIPAGLYLLIHILEGETITPMLLARRFTLNPLLVILSLFFWDYVWGVIGALLAVPLLTIMKIVCDEVPSLKALGHVIGNTPKRDDAPSAART